MKKLRCSLGEREWGTDGVSARWKPRRKGRDRHPPAGTRVESPVRVLISPAHKFPRGGTGPSLVSRKLALAASFVLLALAGCGEADGVAEGAAVTAYVVAPLCAEAERELARHGGPAGEVRVEVRCLPVSERDGKLDLAQIGANARRASEDSSAIAYIGEPTRAATRFSEPILEAAGILQFSETSGAQAMRKLLSMLEEEGRVSLRGNL